MDCNGEGYPTTPLERVLEQRAGIVAKLERSNIPQGKRERLELQADYLCRVVIPRLGRSTAASPR